MNRLVYLLFLVPLIVFSLLLWTFWLGLHQPNPTVVPSPLINKPLPPISAKDLDDNPPMKVTNQVFLGHNTLLNVWASWCSSCRVEHPVLMDIAHSGKIVVYGLNYKDKWENATNWLKKRGNPYILNIFDPHGKVGMDLGVYGTPETFLVDQNGIIRYKYIGPITPLVWQKEILPRIQRLEHQ